MKIAESRLKRLENALKKDKLEIVLTTGDTVLFSDSELLSLYNEAMKLVPVQTKNGEIHYPRAEESLSDNMLSVMYARSGQDEFIDTIQGIVKDWRQQNE